MALDAALRWLPGRTGAGSLQLDGSLHPDFVCVADALRAQLAGFDGGASVCVYHRGRCVVDLWGGVRDAAGTPWTRETMAPSFSTTKGVAATLIHALRDRELLDYDEPVARYWPEFAQAGKGSISIRQVLAHQSGLYHIRRMVDRADRMLDWEYMVRAIERTPPVHEPGTRTGYHGLTFGFLVGEIAQRVTGVAFPELVQEVIARPLALDGLYVGAPDAALERAAELMWPRWTLVGRMGFLPDLGGAVERSAAWLQLLARATGVRGLGGGTLDALAPRGITSFDFGARETLQAAIPAASGLFTARSLARMYAALAAGGALDGARLMSPATLAEATRVQDAPRGRAVLPFDMRWRLGYHGVPTTRGIPRHAFGHFGFGGSGAWADPSRELSVALIVNSGLGTPFGDVRIARMGAAALAGTDRIAPRDPRRSGERPFEQAPASAP